MEWYSEADYSTNAPIAQGGRETRFLAHTLDAYQDVEPLWDLVIGHWSSVIGHWNGVRYGLSFARFVV